MENAVYGGGLRFAAANDISVRASRDQLTKELRKMRQIVAFITVWLSVATRDLFKLWYRTGPAAPLDRTLAGAQPSGHGR
jgi:hypothetical protein